MKKNKTLLVRKIAAIVCLLFISACIARYLNPDGDAFFLIENGRYIVENGWNFPATNPWHTANEIGIVIQQWGCSVANYAWFSLFGLDGMWILAMLFAFLFGTALFCYFRKKGVGACNSVLASALFCTCTAFFGYITTRPYLVTMTVSFLVAATLRSYFELSESERGAKRVRVLGMLLAAVLFQVNYQASFVVMPFLWLWGFAVGDQAEYFAKTGRPCKKEIAFILASTAAMALASLANPYGIRGALYLFYSKSSAGKVAISELVKPDILSVYGVAIVFVLAGSALLFKHKKTGAWSVFLSTGTCIGAALAIRNAWMPLVLAALLVPDLGWILGEIHGPKLAKKLLSDAVAVVLIVAVGSCFLLLSQDFCSYSSMKEAADYLDEFEGKDVRLYTSFNSGAYFEFRGYGVYLDARPELYSPVVTGGKDVLSEWIAADVTGESDAEEFLEQYAFDYLFLDKPSPLWSYARYSGDYEVLVEDGNYVFVKRTR